MTEIGNGHCCGARERAYQAAGDKSSMQLGGACTGNLVAMRVIPREHSWKKLRTESGIRCCETRGSRRHDRGKWPTNKDYEARWWSAGRVARRGCFMPASAPAKDKQPGHTWELVKIMFSKCRKFVEQKGCQAEDGNTNKHKSPRISLACSTTAEGDWRTIAPIIHRKAGLHHLWEVELRW